jgi:hypothetical protein
MNKNSEPPENAVKRGWISQRSSDWSATHRISRTMSELSARQTGILFLLWFICIFSKIAALLRLASRETRLIMSDLSYLLPRLIDLINASKLPKIPDSFHDDAHSTTVQRSRIWIFSAICDASSDSTIVRVFVDCLSSSNCNSYWLRWLPASDSNQFLA